MLGRVSIIGKLSVTGSNPEGLLFFVVFVVEPEANRKL